MLFVFVMVEDSDETPLAGDLRDVLGRLWRRLRAEQGFPITQGAVLGRLEREGPQSIGDLASAERVRSQSMGQTITELEAMGRVSRHPHASDRRRTVIELTDEGRRKLAEERARRDSWLAQAIETGLTDDERRALRELIHLLALLGDM